MITDKKINDIIDTIKLPCTVLANHETGAYYVMLYACYCDIQVRTRLLEKCGFAQKKFDYLEGPQHHSDYQDLMNFYEWSDTRTSIDHNECERLHHPISPKPYRDYDRNIWIFMEFGDPSRKETKIDRILEKFSIDTQVLSRYNFD